MNMEEQIEKIIRTSIQENPMFPKTERPSGTVKIPEIPSEDGDDEKTVKEAYVASPKTYSQVSELVSDKTKEEHVKLYQGYVDKLNEVSAKIDTADRQGANCNESDYRALKIDEAYLHNAVYLHEMYFANCFDPHSEVFMDSLAYLRLERDFGTFADWQKDFMACAASNREGWVICGYSMFLKRYINTFVDSHSTGMMLGLIPVIVVDTWSHSFYKDYMADRKSYIVAMMRELNWEIIEERTKKVDDIHKVNQ